ncbi:MAG: nucleotidyltransferase domain-containing protein [Aquificae bacterium]|nr:nucleotidyltransferase domain-containing protein [Aquificota bacterium]
MTSKVRLSQEEIEAIKNTAKKVFGEGTKVILFGSRVDPNKRGGDIDLYIIPASRENLFDKRIRFLAQLKMEIGDQKIDLVLAEDPSRPIEQEALKTGVEL